MESINRRNFIKTSSVAGLGLSVLPTWVTKLLSQTDFSPVTQRRGFTTALLAEDLLRLVQFSNLHDEVVQALLVNRQLFQLGAAWAAGEQSYQLVLEQSRLLWKDEQQQDRARTQFAFASGWLTHQLISKTLPEIKIPQAADLPESVVYRDVYLMKQLQNADPNRRSIPLDQPVSGLSIESAVSLFKLMHQRNLVRMHTLRPEWGNIEAWLGDFLDYQRRLEQQHLAYARVYCQPESEKVYEYIVRPNFYQADDELIRLARGLQMGLTEQDVRLQEAILKSSSQSAYAKALGLALERLLQLGEEVRG